MAASFRNEGTVDRALRIIVGLVLLSLVFIGPKVQWGWIGIVPLATGLIGWCPLYRLLGMNTCGVKSRP
jgi:membrane protein implicated in regulation of membrane protease activity